MANLRAFFEMTFSNIPSISAIIVTALALYGVREWKRQTIGKTDYEIARRYLKAGLRLRDALKYVRDPFISEAEMESALKDHGFESDIFKDRERTNRAVYSVRWKSVLEARSELEIERLEAEVSWGYQASVVSRPLISLTIELLVALQIHLDGQWHSDFKDELIYNQGSEDVPDTFSKNVELAVNELRDFLKPHLS